MTVEELRKEAKALGYSIIPIVRTEKLLPCVCGSKRRDHWITYVKGTRMQVLKCRKCGRSECGTTVREASHNWNVMVRGEQDAQTD